MTPQLQQAIRLLQLSSLELQTEIQEVLETNPLLEVEEDFEFDENRKLRNDEDSQELGQAENDHIPEDLPVDTQWEDTFDHQPVTNLSAGPVVDAGLERENQDESTDTLQEHLMWQMRLTPFTPTEQAIATLIIDSIEEDGYLKATVESIHESLFTDLEELDVEEVETVLHRIQHFDPVGVAARDLRECLLIQLRVLEASGMEQSALLKELIDQHLDTLAKRDYAAIRRALKVTDEELTDLVKANKTQEKSNK
jgi:RNA polymerase sigma-54 factor